MNILYSNISDWVAAERDCRVELMHFIDQQLITFVDATNNNEKIDREKTSAHETMNLKHIKLDSDRKI